MGTEGREKTLDEVEKDVDQDLRITLKKLHIATAKRLLNIIENGEEVTAGVLQAATKMCKDNNQFIRPDPKIDDLGLLRPGMEAEVPDDEDIPTF